MTDFLPNGLGGTFGDDLITNKPTVVSSDVFYVDSQTGSNSNTGLDREAPFATLAYALGFVGRGDVVVCLSGHTEEILSTLTTPAIMTLVGEGSLNGEPTVKLIKANGDEALLCTQGIQIRNIKFQPPGLATTPLASASPWCDLSTGDGVQFIGCVFETDRYMDAAMVRIQTGSTDVMFLNCTFKSIETSTLAADRPYSPLRCQGAGQTIRLTLEGVIFDGGVSNFRSASNNNWAFDSSSSQIDPVRAANVSLLNGADIKMTSGWGGHFGFLAMTGSSRFEGS